MSTMAPLVSVLSPVFNEADHIEEMISSVLAQSHANLELIVVDDGSTDSTVALAESAAKKDARVRVTSEGKLGKVRAFNRAFAEARGDIVILMGGDDIMPTGSIKSRVDAVAEASQGVAGSVAVFARLRTFSSSARFDGQIIPRSEKKGARSGGTLALSRSLANKLFPIPEELIAEDIWLGEAAASLAEEIINLPDVVLEYRIHAGNSNPRNQSYSQMTEAMHQRMIAYRVLSENERIALAPSERERFAILAVVEDYRYQGRLFEVLRSKGAPLGARLRAASMSRSFLFRIRTRMFKWFSGW